MKLSHMIIPNLAGSRNSCFSYMIARHEPDVAKGIRDYYEKYAIPASSFANMVAFAMSQPEDVDINEILFRPTRQEL